MSICKNCGTNVPDERKFCNKCGFKIEPEPQEQPIDIPAQSNVPLNDEINSQPVQTEAQSSQTYQPQQSYNTQGFSVAQFGRGKPKWFIPAIAGALAVVLILMGIFVVKIISSPGANTPEGAVELKIEKLLDISKDQAELEIKEETLDMSSDKASAWEDGYKELCEYYFDKYDYKIISTTQNGNEAKVTVEFSMPDDKEASKDVKKPSKKDSPEDVKKAFDEVIHNMKNAPMKTEKKDFKVKYDGSEWNADINSIPNM